MVLACASNSAAANVTRELPLTDSIDADWDYYSGTASAVLKEPAWGLVAAQLGNRQNTADFFRGFSFDKDHNFNSAVRQSSVSWAEARRQFLDAKRDVDALVDQARASSDAVADYEKWRLQTSITRDQLASAGWLTRWWRRRALKRSERQLAINEGILEPFQQLFGDFLVSSDRLAGREGALSSAWLNPGWVAAQERLFRSALRLHEAFHRETWSSALQDNMWLFTDLLMGRGGRLSSEQKNALWQSFFVVVPLVSTTFASVARLFRGIRDMGIAVVDEAGQVAPPAIAGLADRSQRLIALGDPSQLEPVVTIPASVRRHLRGLYSPAPMHSDDSCVQRIADQLSPVGTKRQGDWVGSPLIVHRRCADPMFSISNALAYDDQMVHGAPASIRPTPIPSRWIDAAGGESRGNWIPAEGAALLRELPALPDGTDYFVITPFRDVLDGLEQLDQEHALGWKSEKRVGTIHTFQGREAEGVVLVLGGGSAGARNWAGQRANLANVSITRAKGFVWVVGDREAWRKTASFALVDRMLTEGVPSSDSS